MKPPPRHFRPLPVAPCPQCGTVTPYAYCDLCSGLPPELSHAEQRPAQRRNGTGLSVVDALTHVGR